MTKTSFEDTAFSNYHDIITGWILKIVVDECGYGAKSGAPYVIKQTGRESATTAKRRLDEATGSETQQVRDLAQGVKLKDDKGQSVKAYLRSKQGTNGPGVATAN